MLPILTYIVGYKDPDTKEVHLVLTKTTNQVLAINQARIQFPTNFKFYLLESIGKKMNYYKIYLLNKKDKTKSLVEVEAENVDQAIEKAKNQLTRIYCETIGYRNYLMKESLVTEKVETKW